MNYIKAYFQIITKAAGREYSILYDRHHIIPRGLGGPDNITNLIYLTPKEHMLAHHLLAKAYPTVHEIQSGFNVPTFKYYNILCYIDRAKNIMMNMMNSKHRNTNVQQLGELYRELAAVDMDKIVFASKPLKSQKKSKPVENVPETPRVVNPIETVAIAQLNNYLETPIPSTRSVQMDPVIAQFLEEQYIPLNADPEPDPTVEVLDPPKKKRPTLKRIKAPEPKTKPKKRTTRKKKNDT